MRAITTADPPPEISNQLFCARWSYLQIINEAYKFILHLAYTRLKICVSIIKVDVRQVVLSFLRKPIAVRDELSIHKVARFKSCARFAALEPRT